MIGTDYIFGRNKGVDPIVVGQQNTFIGGVESIITNAEDLAAKLSITASDIHNFEIINGEIKCFIGVDYNILSQAFYYLNILFYDDIEGFCKEIGFRSFEGNALRRLFFPGVIYLDSYAIAEQGSPKSINRTDKRRLIFPACTNIGHNSEYNYVFDGFNATKQIIYVDEFHQTSNNGAIEEDLRVIRDDWNGEIRFINASAAPSQITDLTIVETTNTAVKVSFTTPNSTNQIDFYEVYVNGVRKNEHLFSKDEWITNLDPHSSLNIQIVAVDFLYKKGDLSNHVTKAATGTPVIDTTNMKTYYKLDSINAGVITDSFGTNNGTAVGSPVVQAGKINQSINFPKNSYIDLAGLTSTSKTYTILFWLKLSVTGTQFFFDTSAGRLVIGNYNGKFSSYDGGWKQLGGYFEMNRFNHYAVVFDSASNKMIGYQSGVLAGSAAYSPKNIGSTVRLGRAIDGGAPMDNGNLDEFMIYEGILSGGKISDIYNRGNGLTL